MKEFWRAVVKNYSKNQIICPLNHRKTTSEFLVQRKKILSHFGLEFMGKISPWVRPELGFRSRIFRRIIFLRFEIVPTDLWSMLLSPRSRLLRDSGWRKQYLSENVIRGQYQFRGFRYYWGGFFRKITKIYIINMLWIHRNITFGLRKCYESSLMTS